MFGVLLVSTRVALVALAVARVVIGVHALLFGHMPGQWLPRLLRGR